jgi:Flp pilus assembly protein CpaB
MLAKTMTFEVSPKQVEVIGVMSGLGTLSLSLRSLDRDDQPAPETDANRVASISHTIDSQVSPLIQHRGPGKSGTSGVIVLRGSRSSTTHVSDIGALGTPSSAGGAQ